ncbi:MAG: TAXI family TRAP transporter solute-binding subunit [Selenomonadaceae bacterium]|nr:TAXI family TRAP transporter solute-binding subunit [Selenomonadaceae bacterium]
MGFGKFFKRIATVCLALAVAVGVAGCGGGADSGEKFVHIATGGTAGTYYPIGGAIADIIKRDVKGIDANAQSTGASVANINMLNDKQVDMAIVQNDIAYYALNGTEMFEKKVEGLRGIASLYPETCQFVTLDGSGIHSISDLKGKRVAVGAQGSGVECNVRQILKVYGMTYEDINPQFLSFAEASAALKDGTVDVACLTAGYPTTSVQDIASQKQIRLIPLDSAKIDALIADYPFYTRTTIPADTYQGFSAEVPTVSVMAILVTTDRMDAQTGYDITKAIFSNTDKLAAAHSAAKAISKETALNGMNFIKMNEGAEKFLKE